MVVQSAPSTLAEQRITLRNISWETYELILADQADSRSPRFVYDRGDLDVVSPLRANERANWSLASRSTYLRTAITSNANPARSCPVSERTRSPCSS